MALRSPSTISGTRTFPVMSRMTSRFTSPPRQSRVGRTRIPSW